MQMCTCTWNKKVAVAMYPSLSAGFGLMLTNLPVTTLIFCLFLLITLTHTHTQTHTHKIFTHKTRSCTQDVCSFSIVYLFSDSSVILIKTYYKSIGAIGFNLIFIWSTITDDGNFRANWRGGIEQWSRGCQFFTRKDSWGAYNIWWTFGKTAPSIWKHTYRYFRQRISWYKFCSLWFMLLILSNCSSELSLINVIGCF